MSQHLVGSREPPMAIAIALGLMFVFAPAMALARESAQDPPQYGEPGGTDPGLTTAPGQPGPATSPLAVPPEPPTQLTPAAATPAAPPTPTPPSTPPAPEPMTPSEQAEHQRRLAHHQAASGQAVRGFVMSASLGVRPSLIVLDSGTAAQSFTLQGGLAIGFKYKRVILTLGVDFGGTDSKRTFSTDRAFNVLVIPGLQIALYRSRDQRVELIGSLRVGAGASIVSSDVSSPSPTPLVMYEIAPGVRYWAHKQLAIQALAGVGGEYAFSTGTSSTQATGVHSLVASLGAIGVF